MRITRVKSELLHVPLSRPRASPTEAATGRHNHIVVLLVQVHTDADLTGLGFAYALQGSGRAMLALVEDDLAPLVIDEDPLDHERLAMKVYWRLQTIGRRGLVQQAYSAIDLALWDLKGKAAGLPLYKLLGGARESAPVYGSDSAWLWMSPEQILDASRHYLDQGMMGIKVKVGADPEADAHRLTQLREALGDDVWLGVDANERYDYSTALAMGHFFEDEIGADWFEEPITCEDIEGHARLSSKLEIAIAGGEMLFGLDEFRSYLNRDAFAVVQPDVTRLGGLTGCLKVVALAEAHHRPVAPHLLPEVGVHLACGLSGVSSVEYMPWLYPLFRNPPRIEKGHLVPPPHPGLGLELDTDAVTKCRARL
ncbi:MAG TPA: mandelate racemase/muconate lactonizing enzyme family protein [Gemmataceae bacterium]|jgi:L-alanine-DL-glutamate epimerase-like enolase superfamily enzyme